MWCTLVVRHCCYGRSSGGGGGGLDWIDTFIDGGGGGCGTH